MSKEQEQLDLNLDTPIDFKEINPPNLFQINQSLSEIEVEGHTGVRGEEHNRLTIFTAFVLGRCNLLLSGSRASGKSLLIDSVVNSFSEIPIVLSQGSDKSHIRDADKLNEGTHFIIPEINQIPQSILEGLKLWGEGKPFEYKTLNENKRVIKFKIESKPFITSVADENVSYSKLGDELVSRMITLNTNTSTEQNKEVIKHKLSKAQNPFGRKKVTKKEIKNYQTYVKSLPSINEFGFIFPVGDSILNAIPPLFTDSRRDVDKYLKNTYGISLFHLHNRMTVKRGEKTYIIVTPEDAWLNQRIFGDMIVDSALKCSKIGKKIMKILTENQKFDEFDIGLKVKEIHSSLLEIGLSPSSDTIRKHCDELCKYGYAVKNGDLRDPTFSPSKFFKEYESGIDWVKVIEECKKSIREILPELAEEYIQKYCTPPLRTIDPFEGTMVDILTWKNDSEVTVKKETKLSTFSKENLTPEFVGDIAEETDLTSIGSKPFEQSFIEWFKENDFDSGCDCLIIDELHDSESVKKLIDSGIIFEKNGRYFLL